MTESCEEITIPICNELSYSLTSLPNTLGHTNQEEAGQEVHQFLPLVETGCSRYLQEFLCILYVPPCDVGGLVGRVPCRELCEAARGDCEIVIEQNGFQWPKTLACERFPATYFSSVYCNLGSLRPGEYRGGGGGKQELAITIHPHTISHHQTTTR